eukprot:6213941-Pleurochrysis_carterae.AAC.2
MAEAVSRAMAEAAAEAVANDVPLPAPSDAPRHAYAHCVSSPHALLPPTFLQLLSPFSHSFCLAVCLQFNIDLSTSPCLSSYAAFFLPPFRLFPLSAPPPPSWPHAPPWPKAFHSQLFFCSLPNLSAFRTLCVRR